MTSRRLLCVSMAVAHLVLGTACDDADDADADDFGADAGVAEPDGAVDCATDDLTFAPPPTAVAGLHAVPMDVHAVEATVIFDAAEQASTAVATMHFALGNEAGNPVFDLRQGVDRVSLNGTELTEDDIWHQDLGGGVRAQMRVIKPPLAACSENTLELEYPLREPGAPGAQAPRWEADGLYWNLDLRDVSPARYLEQWLPSNLIHDRYPVTLDVELVGTDVEHVLISNGAVEAIDSGRWRVEFPADFTPLSQMLVLMPASAVVSQTTVDTETMIEVEAYRESTLATPIDELVASTVAALQQTVASEGAYPHGDRFVVLFWDLSRGMEYDGATTTSTSALPHEVLHSWYGRSTKPATANDGWLDEAWTVYLDDPPQDALTFDDAPVVLSPASPWSRHTPTEAYDIGARMFVTLAEAWSPELLSSRMRAFFTEHRGALVTTDQLERYLYCESSDGEVRRLFHRFVRGLDGEPAPPSPEYCP